MAIRPIAISWELLLALCQVGTTVRFPELPDEESVCLWGVSHGSTVESVIVSPDRTLTILVNDPEYDGVAMTSPMWERRTL